MVKISVIVPVYNTELYLNKCVDSIVNQTYKNLEIILVDDGSKQPAHDMCDEWGKRDSRIKVVHKQNGGLSSARNAGIEVATGDYIGFVDSDDYVSQNFYELLLGVCTFDDCFACSHFVRVDEVGNIRNRKDPRLDSHIIPPVNFARDLMLHIGDVSVCSKLFPAKVIGTTRFREGVLNEDLLFMLDILPKVSKIAFTGKVGYYYLCRANSISSKYGKSIEDMVLNSIEVRDRLILLYPVITQECNRFVLFQHMAYLLLVPKDLRTRNNTLYSNAKSYVRNHFFAEGLCNRYLTTRDKLILLSQVFIPGFVASMYQRKH